MVARRAMTSASGAPRVTAIITTYQPNFAFLRSAVASALAQRIPVHVLVSDSGADDTVRRCVEEFGERITYRHNGHVVGPAENHRRAIAEVRTPYFALLGYDDTWEPEFLETLVPALDANPDCVLAFSDHWFMNMQGHVDVAVTDRMTAHWGRARLAAGRIDTQLACLSAQTVPVAMSTLLRSEVAQRHPIPDESGAAYDLWLHYAMATERRPYWYSPARLTRWRFHDAGGTATGNPDWYRGAAFTWDAVLSDPQFSTIHHTASHRSAVAWLALSKALLRRGAARTAVVEAAQCSWRHERGVQSWILSRWPELFRVLRTARRTVSGRASP